MDKGECFFFNYFFYAGDFCRIQKEILVMVVLFRECVVRELQDFLKKKNVGETLIEVGKCKNNDKTTKDICFTKKIL